MTALRAVRFVLMAAALLVLLDLVESKLRWHPACTRFELRVVVSSRGWLRQERRCVAWEPR